MMWLFKAQRLLYAPSALTLKKCAFSHFAFVCGTMTSFSTYVCTELERTNYCNSWEFISVFNQLDAQSLFHNKFYFMPLHVSSTCAHHQEVKIALHSLWYHYTYRCDDFDLLMMSTCARNMYRHEIKLIVKQILCIKLVKYWNKQRGRVFTSQYGLIVIGN